MNYFRRPDHYEPLPNTASVDRGPFEEELATALELEGGGEVGQGEGGRSSGLTTTSPISGRHERGFVKRVLDAVVQSCSSFLSRNAGMLLVASSQAFFALMNVFVKILNSLDPPMPPLQLVLVRMVITYICCTVFMILTGVKDPFWGPKEVRKILFIRGFSGFFGLFGMYYSLSYLSLSDATVISFLAPAATGVAGYFLLGEKLSRKEVVAGLLMLVGVVLIARPQFLFGTKGLAEHAPSVGEISRRQAGSNDGSEGGVTPAQRLVAVGVALIGVVGATGAYTSIRAIGKRAHAMHTMNYFSMMCVTTSAAGMILTHEAVVLPTRFLWFALLMMIGIFGFLAQTLLTLGLQRETAGRGTLAVYVQIIFASILERIVFHTVPTLLSIAGTVIIVSSALFVALTKKKHMEAEQTDKLEDVVELESGTRLLDGDGTPRRVSFDKGPPQERKLEHDRDDHDV